MLNPPRHRHLQHPPAMGLLLATLLSVSMFLAACALTPAHDSLASDRAARAQLERQERAQVRHLLAQAIDARRARDYDAAQQAVNQARAIRPHDPAVNAVQQGLDDTRIILAAEYARQARDRAIAQQRVQNFRASTPYASLQNYPHDWPDTTRRRQSW